MKPNAIKKKVGTFKYYLDQTISTSPTTLTDEQLSEIVLKYFTGLQSSPNSKGKRYIKGDRKTVTLTDGKTPTSMGLSTGASFKVTTNGDTVIFTSDVAPAKGDAAGVSAQFVHTITTTDGATSHSFTQTRMVGDKPISQETFTVELPKGATFSKDNLVDIFVADSSYSQVDPLAPRIATPVQNKPTAIIPVAPTAVAPVDSSDEEEVLSHTHIDEVPLEYFLNNGQPVDQRLARRFTTPTSDNEVTPTGVVPINPITQGDNNMADTPRQEQGFNIVDRSGRIVRHGTRTNEFKFDSLEDWAAVCQEIEQINRTRVKNGQDPVPYPSYQTTDENGQPITHTYIEGSSQNNNGLVPAGGQRRNPSQNAGGMVFRTTNPVGRREEVREGAFEGGAPVVEEDDHIHIVVEEDDEMRLWRERCAAIDEENRLRATQGKKPRKYPRAPKAQVHKKGKKPVKTPTQLKKVFKKIGQVAIVVAVAVVIVVTAVVGKIHYDKYIAEPEETRQEMIVDGDNAISDTFTPDDGVVEDMTPPAGDAETDDEVQTGGLGGEQEIPVVVNPNVQDDDQGNFLQDPTGGDGLQFGPSDDVEDTEDAEEAEKAAKGYTDTSGSNLDFTGDGSSSATNKGAPKNTVEEHELGGQ